MDRIEELINNIEAELVKAKRAGLSNTEVAVNKREMLSLVSRLRGALPDAIHEAMRIVADRDDIRREARDAANELVMHAEERSQRLINESEIVKQAEQKSAEIMQKAQADADKIMRDTIAFCRTKETEARVKLEDLLAESEEQLTRAVMTIRDTRDDLRNRKKP